MIIDLHLHEEIFSSCSVMSLADAVAAAQKQGLDALCVTNHNSLDIRDSDLIKTLEFPVFIGVEYFAIEGEIIAFGIDSIPDKKIPAQEFIDFVNDQNGFCFAAHPYRINSGVADTIHSLQRLHGVEVCNGGNLLWENEKAWLACLQLGLVAVGGSDAHRPMEVGRYATWFPSEVKSVQEVVAVLRSGACYPVTKGDNGIWQKVTPSVNSAKSAGAIKNQVLFSTQKNTQSRPVCAVCGDVLFDAKGNFCSPRCERDYYMRIDRDRVRRVIYTRDDGICMRCGREVAQEHFHLATIVSPADGGDAWALDNLEVACPECDPQNGTRKDKEYLVLPVKHK